MKSKEYAYYNKRDELVATGTKRELAEQLGVKVETIDHYTTPTYRKRIKRGIRVIVVDDVQFINNVDLDRIKALRDEHDYKNREIAEVLGTTAENTSAKINGHTRFSKKEIELLEDLFFLDDGELIKGE